MYPYQKIEFVDTQAQMVPGEIDAAAPDQIIVQAECSLISPGTERAALIRLWDDPTFRANPGYALVGQVVEIGKDVTNYQVGERVITLSNHASVVACPAVPWMALRVPERVHSEDATFVVLGSVALHAIHRCQIQFGETLLILGSGIIGLIALQLAKQGGARQVIMLDLAQERLELAQSLGADLALNPRDPDTHEQVLEATGGKGPTVVIEATGNPQAVLDAFQLAAYGGRIICTGLMETPITLRFHPQFIQHELSLVSAYQPLTPTQDNLYWHWTQQANRSLLLEMLASHDLQVTPLITDRIPASRAPAFYDRLKGGDTGMLGVILNW